MGLGVEAEVQMWGRREWLNGGVVRGGESGDRTGAAGVKPGEERVRSGRRMADGGASEEKGVGIRGDRERKGRRSGGWDQGKKEERGHEGMGHRRSLSEAWFT
jgi:hypothetical protein